MYEMWTNVTNVVLEMKPDQVITLVVVALFLSAGTAGLFRLIARGKTDVTAVLTALVLVSSLVSMLTAAGFLHATWAAHRSRQVFPQFPANGRREPTMSSQFDTLATHLLMQYDSDRDGRLSAEEGARAVSRLIDEAAEGTDHPGSLDETGLRRLLRRQTVVVSPMVGH